MLLVALVASLFLLEGAHFAMLAGAFHTLYRDAGNTTVMSPGVAFNAGLALVFVLAGFGYWGDPFGLRQYLPGLFVLFVLYGGWAFAQSYPQLMDWSGLFSGDFVASDVASAIGFMALGFAGLCAHLARARGFSGGRC